MKIAFLASRFPYPLDKGDKVRAYHQIKHLSKKHSIYLICLSEGDVAPDHIAHLQTFCADIKIYPIRKPGIGLGMVGALFSGLPFQVGYFYRSEIKKRITAHLNSIQPDTIVCQLLRMAEYVKGYKHPNKVLDYMDVFSADMLRRKQVSSGLEKMVFGSENTRVLKYEKEVFPFFQKHTIISGQDRDLLPVKDSQSVEVIPNGIDFDYQHTAKPEKHYDILFFGNMGYTSNIESAVFLAQKVVPLLVKQFPNLKVLIAGAEPHKRVLALQDTHVEVSGWIDDKWACYASARIFAAPMLISVGMQNKILEAMAVNVPCVVTSMANNAIGANNGKEILVADTPEDFAAAIAQLLKNEDFASQMATNAHAFITKNYVWSETVERLERYILK
jgi:sugar transferase (PEP-CTERM/EpsH1 system associated)